MAGIVPAGFESHLRILHKGHGTSEPGLGTGPDPLISWGTVASALGRNLEEQTLWADLSGKYGEPALVPGVGTVYPPEEGRLDCPGFTALADLLAETSDGPFYAGFWTGWEPLSEYSESAEAIRLGQTVSIQGESYLFYVLSQLDLAAAAFLQFPQLGWKAGNGLTPNYLWPTDESWLLVSNVDFDSSILAGSSSLVETVKQLSDLECIPVRRSTDLTSSIRPAP
ncbi:hypothetical protein [Arthrobacter sp. M4]|uniref:hypothetical protein n=1 Tax=Arthrobacter sp. M4 TaxID=218160 RepID=UPI001CDB4F72|nr:hypothetical protein [Arthrobacter sp. M4]